MMKMRTIVFLLVCVLLNFSFVYAQTQMQTYSGFDRFVDGVKMFFVSGDDEVRLALEIREKEIDSAMNNIQNGDDEKAVENLERAKERLQMIQEKVSLNTSGEIKESVSDVKNKIDDENFSVEFEEYFLEEDKTRLVAELTEKTFEYCKELAKGGYQEILKEEICNPDTAVPGLEKELKELKDIQEKLFVQLMLDIRSCIDDPGTCNCDEVLDADEKEKCGELVALAVKCEYKNDEDACNELESMKPKPGDGFVKSFIPDFLMNLFSDKRDMIEYNLNHSDGVPEECWDENDKPECEQYDYLKETRLDWDEYGNFIGTRRARGIQEPVPTMRESIPQCYDGENFLEEKCGKITIVRNEKGLVNYIIEKDVEKIIDKFENVSTENRIDEFWTVDEGRVQNKVVEIKEEMNQINNQIVEITYAIGTGPGGVGGVVVEGDKQGIVTGDGNGDDGFETEIKTDVAGDGGDLTTTNSDSSQNEVVTNNVVEGDGGEGDYAEGTTAGGESIVVD